MASTAICSYDLSENFEWRPEYQPVLEHIASTDTLDPNTEWQLLREMIKYKINQNIGLFLADAGQPMEPAKPATGTVDSSGNLRLPPFPPRRPDELMNPHEIPNARMNLDEANETKNFIFRQLHEFEDNPPFTIQRVCELCVNPKQHYKFIGKYLRAVEKSVLVTSTWDAFPIELPQNGLSIGAFPAGPLRSAPPTPMFSPIPFLHDDARRSKSQSPPPSPLALRVMDVAGTMQSLEGSVPQRAIGLVDELDDPSPGHMSDHPTAISSVTTIGSRPFLETLETRFVRASEDQSRGTEDQKMTIDDADDKENKI